MAKQTPKEIGVSKDFWNSNYDKPSYRNGYQMRYVDENRNWGQRNGYGRRYGNGNKNQQRRAHGGSATQTQTYYTTPKRRASYRNTPSRRIGGGQGNGNGNGEDKDDKNRKRYRDTKYDFEEKDEEGRDTEDSFEFEITPQQLSQVTPGGGVLKLTLSRRGPLKITIEAQKKKPDPSQTTIKTVYDPTKEGPLQGGENIEIKGTSRRGARFGNQRIKPREAPNDKRDGNFPEDGGPVKKINQGGSGNPDGNGGPDKSRKPPRRGEEPPNGFRRINGSGGGSDPSDDDGDGGGSTPASPENIPPTRKKQRRPKFVYVLQGRPGPPGQEGQPGQAGRDGRDGQIPQLTKALEDALKTQKTSWDTTNLEKFF